MPSQIPFDFILELLAEKNPITKPMFGCHGVYIEDKIIFILRNKQKPPIDDGVWLCTSAEHHESLKKDFPTLRDISIFAPGPTNTQNLPLDTDNFEEAVTQACDLVLQNDPRIGRIPKTKLRTSRRKSASQKNPRKKAGATRKAGKKKSAVKNVPQKKITKTRTKKSVANRSSVKKSTRRSSKSR